MPSPHMKRESEGVQASVTAGFTPGGHIPSGYSYLQRSHSLVTPSRRTLPQGLESPRTDKQLPSNPPTHPASPRAMSSPVMLQHSGSNNSLSDSLPSPRLGRSDADAQTIAGLVAQLPPNPKVWTPSQVALYLTHVLGLTPKPIVEDVTAYVRRSRMGGKVFLRLREKDLESEGLNLKWRKLMIEAVKKLRRDCLRGRIWGFEGGLELPRQEDEMQDEIRADEEVKAVPVTAKGTLKRLRDKKAIRSMISSFENANQDGRDEEEAFVALGGTRLASRGSVSSLHSNEGSDQSTRSPMPPIYGAGFVKSRAESFTSLNDVSQSFKRKEITKEELEHWFGSLSEQEAEVLASELQEDEELVKIGQEDQRARNRSSSSEHSSASGEIGPFTPPAVEKSGFDLTPLSPEIVHAIVGHDSPAQALSLDGAITPHIGLLDVEPHREEEGESPSFASLRRAEHLRPGMGGKASPYRRSTYEPEEMEALGLTVEDEDDIKFGTARKISRPASTEEEAEPSVVEMSAAYDSIRIKRTGEDSVSELPAYTVTDERMEHMSHMSAHEASGLSPYKPVSSSMSRKSSQRKHGEASMSAVVEVAETQGEEAKEKNMATFGRKGGVNCMQLSAMLEASGMADGPGSNDDAGQADEGKKAENESEWGVTVSRKASRRGTLVGGAVVRKETAAASRMAELFTPADPSELSAANLKELERKEQEEESRLKDHLYLPLTSFERSDDGKGSIRKRSMVLVERKRFESLATRMGALESQLADLESASLPPLSDLGSMANRGLSNQTASRALDEVFTIPPPPSTSLVETEKERKSGKEEDQQAPGWVFSLGLGAIPSYALGLGAGVGFVLLSEVLGRSRY